MTKANHQPIPEHITESVTSISESFLQLLKSEHGDKTLVSVKVSLLGDALNLGITSEQFDEIFKKVWCAYVDGAKFQPTIWLANYLARLLTENATKQSLGYIDDPNHLAEYHDYATDHFEHFGCLPLQFASPCEGGAIDDVEYGTDACWEAAGRLGLLDGDEIPFTD